MSALSSAQAMHGDVLSAAPRSPEAQARLVAECRERAKVAIKRGMHPVAELLYTKAIETLPDAPLYGNRSMVRATLGKFQEAADDAGASIALDAAYLKAYHRKGTALLGLAKTSGPLQRFNEAEEAFREGLARDGASADFRKAIKKVVDARSVYEQQEAKRATETPMAAVATPSVVRRDVPTAVGAEGAAVNGKAAGGEGEMRGYRRTADGRVTTFFNNDLTPEAAALIGDITPQRISAPSEPEGAGSGSGSAWNMAGTFEERNCTDWARERLAAELGKLSVELPDDGGLLRVTGVEDWEGDAVVAMRRGKKSHIFDLAFRLKFAGEGSQSNVKGALIFGDVSSGDLDEAASDGNTRFAFGCRLEVDSTTPPGARPVLHEFASKEGSGLRGRVQEVVVAFYEEFKAEK